MRNGFFNIILNTSNAGIREWRKIGHIKKHSTNNPQGIFDYIERKKLSDIFMILNISRHFALCYIEEKTVTKLKQILLHKTHRQLFNID